MAPKPASAWNVFGADDRLPMFSSSHPWSAIGKLDSGCTATLVSRNLVLTAAHCVLDAYGNVRSVRFYPNAMSNTSLFSSPVIYAWYGGTDYKTNPTHDWAILQLADALGDLYGWLGVKDEANVYWVNAAGYSGDFYGGATAGAHINCRVMDERVGMWLHDCDTSRGSSGGPIFITNEYSQSFVVAVNTAENRQGGLNSLHVGFYHPDYANYAVPARYFLPTLRRLLGL